MSEPSGKSRPKLQLVFFSLQAQAHLSKTNEPSYKSRPNDSLDITTFISSQAHRGNVAFIDGSTGQQLTYVQLWDAVRSVAASLSDMGIRKGHVVLLLSPNFIFFSPSALHSLLALRFQLSDNFDGEDDFNVEGNASDSELEAANFDDNYGVSESATRMRFAQNQSRFRLPLDLEPPWPIDWQRRDEIVAEGKQRRPSALAPNHQAEDTVAGGCPRSSGICVLLCKKAFSSMVFIIRELHSYTLQMREILFDEDLQGIVCRVQKEMQASFVWLFQQVFVRLGSDHCPLPTYCEPVNHSALKLFGRKMKIVERL